MTSCAAGAGTGHEPVPAFFCPARTGPARGRPALDGVWAGTYPAECGGGASGDGRIPHQMQNLSGNRQS